MSQTIPQCEQCQQRYHLFRRKKECLFCGQSFCSRCICNLAGLFSSTVRLSCSMCQVILNTRSTDDDVAKIRVKHLRAYLLHSKWLTSERLQTFLEKDDLVRYIQARKRNHFVEPVSAANERETTATGEEPSIVVSTTTTTEVVRLTLADLPSLESIESLSVGQLKDLLRQNFVSMKGCLEKEELIGKVQLLFEDHQQSNEPVSQRSDDNLCKVCLDGPSACVFLDCGHLCTCVPCGKRLSECPLCRSYIVRVVRVFKS